jgi:hypothetical protein|tara:strand:- start:328 stop:564 length:237 start_codon:yes stop_codon:yes gene_type:complete
MKNLEILVKENPLLVNVRTNVISFAINMQLNRIITKSVLYYNNGWCVRNGGINIICHTIDDLYLDTKENRLELLKRLK